MTPVNYPPSNIKLPNIQAIAESTRKGSEGSGYKALDIQEPSVEEPVEDADEEMKLLITPLALVESHLE